MEGLFVTVFMGRGWKSQGTPLEKSEKSRMLVLYSIQCGGPLIFSTIHYFLEESLTGLGVAVHLDKILVHMYGMDGCPSLLEVQFIKGDDQAEGFQKGTEAYYDSPGPDLDVTTIGVLVQKEQVVDFHTGRGDFELWGSNASQGNSFLQGKGLSNGPIDPAGNILIRIGEVQ